MSPRIAAELLWCLPSLWHLKFMPACRSPPRTRTGCSSFDCPPARRCACCTSGCTHLGIVSIFFIILIIILILIIIIDLIINLTIINFVIIINQIILIFIFILILILILILIIAVVFVDPQKVIKREELRFITTEQLNYISEPIDACVHCRRRNFS
eukprot:GHVT01049204.1.p1 GENE.GHVT01049204.1~~GHVT01049204.1.p1  ORF type:complete len:156 (-),score=6.56 GHVT01049204.1:533-1000(-)